MDNFVLITTTSFGMVDMDSFERNWWGTGMRWVTSFRVKNFSNYINSFSIVKELALRTALFLRLASRNVTIFRQRALYNIGYY